MFSAFRGADLLRQIFNVSGFPGFWIAGILFFRLLVGLTSSTNLLDFWISKFLDFWSAGFLDLFCFGGADLLRHIFNVSGFPGFWIAGILLFRLLVGLTSSTNLLDFWVSGFQNSWISGVLDFWILSAFGGPGLFNTNLDFWISGFLSIGGVTSSKSFLDSLVYCTLL